MAVAGIVAEYNPFHRGHRWQIEATRRALGADTAVVCAMSGNWVQRGECALTDKWTRAALALRGGADLVLEVPTVWACASAETFARGAVGVLAATGVVDTLSFGSESGDLAALRRTAARLDTPEYHQAVRRLVRDGMAFPAARQAAAGALLGGDADCLARPNDNLGVEYLRALPSEIRPLAIPRRGVGHHGGTGEGFASATYLRTLLRGGGQEKAVPYLTEPWRWEAAEFSRCERALLARIRTMGPEDWAQLPDSGAAEGLPGRLTDWARRAASVEEFLSGAKTRRYAHARLRRLLVWAFLGLRAADRPGVVPYLRVLGFTGRGRALLGEMRDRARAPVVTKPAHARRLPAGGARLFGLEARCTDLFALCLPQVPPGGWEWTSSPVREMD